MITSTTSPFSGYRLTRDIAERLSRTWWIVLLNGLLSVVAGTLVFSIDWDLESLAVFIGALLVLQGIATAAEAGVTPTMRRSNVVAGILSTAVGVAVIAWPGPGLLAVAVVLGAWLIVMGTVTMAAALATRKVLPYWWLWLLVGLTEIPLGVLALANPGGTLAAIVTVAGIWAVAVGVMRIVLSFEIKRLPHDVDEAYGATSAPERNGAAGPARTPAHVA
jgi:uncharacterized membrane protein HdeD (DUF308 family)